jgi:hypothetical protein
LNFTFSLFCLFILAVHKEEKEEKREAIVIIAIERSVNRKESLKLIPFLACLPIQQSILKRRKTQKAENAKIYKKYTDKVLNARSNFTLQTKARS